MRRHMSCLAFAIASLAVTGATAEQCFGTLWLQSIDGGKAVSVNPSETGDVQLWLEIELDATEETEKKVVK